MMILPNKKDAAHKVWLYRLLTAIYDQPGLADALYFKGGTCAAMRGFLNRFSVDLDFDYNTKSKIDLKTAKKILEETFAELGLIIKDSSKNVPQYFLKYPVLEERMRNTIKVDVLVNPPACNEYEPARLFEIDRIVFCQTKETMFANKLVAVLDRWGKHKAIAGRDIYDIHSFFTSGFDYNENIIIERTGVNPEKFFQNLIDFIEKRVTKTIIDQDINILLPYSDFLKIRNILKKETILLLKDETKRLSK